MKTYYSAITLNGTEIKEYLDTYEVKIDKVYAAEPNFVAVSGKTVNQLLGDQRTLTVTFEPMNTQQLNTLFRSINRSEKATIKYIDPELGETTKQFTCSSLPAAHYFVSDNGIQFWQIPSISFVEDTNFSGGSG